MATLDDLRDWMLSSRRTYLIGVVLTLLVLASTVAAGWVLARNLIRDQISQRDADLLYATTIMEQTDARKVNPDSDIRSDEEIGFEAAIMASRIKGVLGIRFFDVEGQFLDAVPATVQPANLDLHTLGFINHVQPHSQYRDDIRMSDVFIYLPSFETGQVDRMPLLEVTVPLHRQEDEILYGAAQFLVEGYGIKQQYDALDQHLTGLAGQTFLVAGSLLGVVLWLIYRKVERLNARLASQNHDLTRANEELSMTARSAALGAISSNLMHGLKNPLASLSRYVKEMGGDMGRTGASEDTEEWRNALAAARRMQALVEHTSEVLADARGEVAYEISIRELAESVQQRVLALSHSQGVDLRIEVDGNRILSSRVANLVSLVLVNLLENALQSSPRGQHVKLQLECMQQDLICAVQDRGPGFPPALRQRLFLPCKSSREGGSGIGLAISKKIADYLGATLELSDPPEGGCRFTLILALEPSEDGPRNDSSHQVQVGKGAQS